MNGSQSARPRGSTHVRADGAVDSVQWIDLPSLDGVRVGELEGPFHAWSSRLVAGWVRVRPRGEGLAVQLLGVTLLVLGAVQERERSSHRDVLGGVLARAGGHLSFELEERAEGGRLVVAVRGLRPRLPRWLYLRTQAPLHERVAFAFLRYCRRRIGRTVPNSPPGNPANWIRDRG